MSKKGEKHYSFHMPIIVMTIVTGFVAGATAGFMGYAAHYFHFSEINPDLILAIWQGNWKEGWIGNVVAIITYGVLSILVALIYYMIFKNQKSLWWGFGYGIIIFIVVFFLLPFIIPGLEFVNDYTVTTIVTGLCIFILYGTFIGYSISYEYNERKHWNMLDPQ